MECNKDEALRAKSIAEDKFTKNDFLGAKKFALKAQALYPGLDGISQMLATLDVYVSAENKVSGERDWYGVLGVDPSVDEETMKKKYKRLALLLHPDKNRSFGAEGAFRLISDAWTLLSDKAKRLAYNQRRASNQRVVMHAARPGFQQRVPPRGGAGPGFQQRGPIHSGRAFSQRPPMNNGVSAPASSIGTVPSRPNGVSNGGDSKKTSIPNKQCTTAAKVPPPPPARTIPTRQRIDTFWTICHRCKIHFEYFKMYLNKTLLCPNCKLPFVAKETPPPVVTSRPQNSVPQGGSNSGKNPPNQKGPQSETTRAKSTGPSVDVKAAAVVQQAREKFKRQYAESNASVGLEGSVKLRKVDDMNSSKSKAQGDENSGNTSGKTAAESDCREKEKHRVCSTEERKSTHNIERCDQSKKDDLPANRSDDQLEKSSLKDASGTKDNEGSQDRGMSAPAPYYYDFDQDRAARSFGDNEVWAAYDDIDAMPRLYALIEKVISRDPIELKISWLNPRTYTKFEFMKSEASGFSKSWGEFKVGKCKSCKDINSFSHRINWSKGPHGGILIIPKKDEVWALFKNCKAGDNEVVLRYDMVMVLRDIKEDEGLTIAPLAKVAGFRTVFRMNSDTKTIPKEEMFRLSHRVPSQVLTAHNAPKWCVELDPAAIPLELLKVQTNEANDDSKV